MDSEGASLNVGDKIMGRDANGKARALIEVTQVKGGRALGTVLKGKASNDLTLNTHTPSSSGSSDSGGGRATANKSSGGIMLGYSMNSMTVKPSGSTSISLTGSSFALSGMYQMTVDGGFGARILAGYETLVAKGDSSTATCGGSTSCEVDLSYLGIEALGKYAFGPASGTQFWVGAGLGFLIAMSKSSNILDTSKISTNQTIVAALGMDWRLSPTTFIPLQFDYAIYPDNATSSATQMILRAGYGFSF
ncbi:hypothetical protein AZI86_18820 [Bdellovibrio bacteriovorus]|uniref:Uncharacterized protein n=2 Tax=Bdellovibrio bacteriovorus TaxID=959 RepID=A0A150WDD0_BDEBC|nr:hypothetical protein AZI86_18820 [Bdellovibrio bacteriovorus]